MIQQGQSRERFPPRSHFWMIEMIVFQHVLGPAIARLLSGDCGRHDLVDHVNYYQGSSGAL